MPTETSMSRTTLLATAILASTLALLGGCRTQPPAPTQTASHPPCDKLAPATPAPAEVEQRRTPLYRYAICYPQLGAAGGKLMPALRKWARAQLQTFLKVADQPRPQAWRYELLIDFRVVARGKGFVSVFANGYTYTGGAHGMPLPAAFTLTNGHLLEHPDALFTRPERARAAISAYARKALEQKAAGSDTAWCFKDKTWLRKGSAPTAQNYGIATFTAAAGRANGLRFYFTPYQVAPYACGMQAVKVPARVFRPWLQSDYRALFTEPND
jgi:hypothetical protein